MDKEEYEARIAQGRAFMHHENNAGEWQSDQEVKKPQPPLCKPQNAAQTITLPRNFEKLTNQKNLTELLMARKSHRVYTQKPLTLMQISYLLWATQGVKEIRGKHYATLRTVPSGGGRHPFEMYLLVKTCEGLHSGLYHYLPMSHELEWIKEVSDIDEVMNQCVCEQAWVKKCSVLFLTTCVAYRAEWRYGFEAHRPALIDLGHVGENFYLACGALGLGTCGIAAFADTYCNELLEVDGKEEFIVYAQPVGTIDDQDHEKEQAFYTFLKEA